MRLWSLHPRHLDARGIVALWREGLLARAVLRGETRGYTHHPQLDRFRAHPLPLDAIDAYLGAVLAEADARGYHFDATKITRVAAASIVVTDGQRDREWQHLLAKLEARAPDVHRRWRNTVTPDLHPLFTLQPGPVADWERAGVVAGRTP